MVDEEHSLRLLSFINIGISKYQRSYYQKRHTSRRIKGWSPLGDKIHQGCVARLLEITERGLVILYTGGEPQMNQHICHDMSGKILGNNDRIEYSISSCPPFLSIEQCREQTLSSYTVHYTAPDAKLTKSIKVWTKRNRTSHASQALEPWPLCDQGHYACSKVIFKASL